MTSPSGREPAQGAQQLAGLPLLEVHEHALEDDGARLGTGEARPPIRKALALEVDRESDQLVRAFAGGQARLLPGEDLGLVDLEPSPPLQAEGPRVEARAQDQDPPPRIEREALPQQVVDDPVAHHVAGVRPAETPERLEDAPGLLVHEPLGEGVAADRMLRPGVERP